MSEVPAVPASGAINEASQTPGAVLPAPAGLYTNNPRNTLYCRNYIICYPTHSNNNAHDAQVSKIHALLYYDLTPNIWPPLKNYEIIY